jgi:hypothetical protein
MYNLFKITLLSTLITLFLSFSNMAFSALVNASQGADVPACKTDAQMMTAGSDCRTTPAKYEVQIFEMGVCTSHPFTNNGTKTDLTTMDKTSCSTTFLATDQTNGSTVDIAQAIGGSLDLVGTSTRPANGTYGFPYIILGEKFKVNVSITGNNGNTYSGKNDATIITSGTSTDYDDNLRNFGGPNCESGYVGATIPIGTIDAFLTNASLVRGDETEVSSQLCTKVGKLVGIINLTTPFTIDQDTLNMQFNFIVTDYGINMGDTGSDGYPDDFGSAPFSGTFTITQAPQQ